MALAGNALPEPCARSLVLQARWLHKRLEWHLLGNHLFANAKALVFAGLFFEGPEAQQWLTTGLRIIARELPEQVLSDGGNFERSPMYHAIFLEDLLDLVNAANVWTGQVDAALAESWRNVAGSMLVWLQGMAHPDGKIALFNDAAFGVAPTTQELTAYARRLALSANPADEGHGGPCFRRIGHQVVTSDWKTPMRLRYWMLHLWGQPTCQAMPMQTRCHLSFQSLDNGWW
ncbi:heparinase II/III family protein [Candidatus Aalborgicola defluviihabitans]|uniref:heparinase II/III family protein n=1 Tax=Candidatus Aalborgicola defluviihabitans TaxID=3386187 RepID=UPI0039B976E4